MPTQQDLGQILLQAALKDTGKVRNQWQRVWSTADVDMASIF